MAVLLSSLSFPFQLISAEEKQAFLPSVLWRLDRRKRCARGAFLSFSSLMEDDPIVSPLGIVPLYTLPNEASRFFPLFIFFPTIRSGVAMITSATDSLFLLNGLIGRDLWRRAYTGRRFSLFFFSLVAQSDVEDVAATHLFFTAINDGVAIYAPSFF